MNGIIDIHCHPTIKMYLYEGTEKERDLDGNNDTKKEFDAFHLQVDLNKMKASNTRCIWAAHYVPEKGLMDNSVILSAISGILGLMWKKVFHRLEKYNPPDAVTYQTMNSIRTFERKVDQARRSFPKVTIAHSFAEFKSALDNGFPVIVQTLEGGHMLGRDLPSKSTATPEKEYIAALHLFNTRGIAMITLGHFFDNDITACAQGLPPLIHKLMDKTTYQQNHAIGLTAIGKKVVEEMLSIGIIIDLIHCTEKAREEIYAINNNRRPLVFSHTGVQGCFNSKDFPDDRRTLPSDDEIRKIHDCKGVIGVIMNIYWLKGIDEADLFHVFDTKVDLGIKYVLETIDYIQNVILRYKKDANVACDYICIGTDYDGFTDPPDDMQDISFLNLIVDGLRKMNYPQSDIDKIMFGNSIRVLEQGWH